MGDQDFSRFSHTEEKIPLFHFWIGVGEPGTEVSAHPGLHSDRYYPVAYETSLCTGIKALTAAVLDLMNDL